MVFSHIQRVGLPDGGVLANNTQYSDLDQRCTSLTFLEANCAIITVCITIRSASSSLIHHQLCFIWWWISDQYPWKCRIYPEKAKNMPILRFSMHNDDIGSLSSIFVPTAKIHWHCIMMCFTITWITPSVMMFGAWRALILPRLPVSAADGHYDLDSTNFRQPEVSGSLKSGQELSCNDLAGWTGILGRIGGGHIQMEFHATMRPPAWLSHWQPDSMALSPRLGKDRVRPDTNIRETCGWTTFTSDLNVWCAEKGHVFGAESQINVVILIVGKDLNPAQAWVVVLILAWWNSENDSNAKISNEDSRKLSKLAYIQYKSLSSAMWTIVSRPMPLILSFSISFFFTSPRRCFILLLLVSFPRFRQEWL